MFTSKPLINTSGHLRKLILDCVHKMYSMIWMFYFVSAMLSNGLHYWFNPSRLHLDTLRQIFALLPLGRDAAVALWYRTMRMMTGVSVFKFLCSCCLFDDTCAMHARLSEERIPNPRLGPGACYVLGLTQSPPRCGCNANLITPTFLQTCPSPIGVGCSTSSVGRSVSGISPPHKPSGAHGSAEDTASFCPIVTWQACHGEVGQHHSSSLP